jgi:hypothetical protein
LAEAKSSLFLCDVGRNIAGERAPETMDAAVASGTWGHVDGQNAILQASSDNVVLVEDLLVGEKGAFEKPACANQLFALLDAGAVGLMGGSMLCLTALAAVEDV